MTRFILRRLALTIPVLFGILFLVFALARLVPGDPCRAVLGERASAAVCDAFVKRNGLDQPIPVQFGIYLGQVATGDLGRSLRLSRPVGQMLIDRLPTTIELTLMAMFFAVIIGIPLGIADFKMAGAALVPFGRTVVRAQELNAGMVAAESTIAVPD